MKTVYQASNITEAGILKGLLAASGINAHVKGFYLQGGIGETSPTNFAAVTVEDKQVKEALEIIKKYEENNVSGEFNAKKSSALNSSRNIFIVSIVIIAFFIATLLSAQ